MSETANIHKRYVKKKINVLDGRFCHDQIIKDGDEIHQEHGSEMYFYENNQT